MAEPGKPNNTSDKNKWEGRAFFVFVATGTMVFIVMGATFWRYIWHETRVDVIPSIHTVTNGQHEVIRRDTVLTISTNQYESLLSQLREQNQFLNSLLATFGSSMAIFLAAIGLFTWRMQKKYDTFSGHIRRATEANESLEGKCKEAEEKSDQIVGICTGRIDDHLENATEKLKETSDAALDNISDKASHALGVLKGRIDNGVRKIEGRVTWGVARVTQEAIIGHTKHLVPPTLAENTAMGPELSKLVKMSTQELYQLMSKVNEQGALGDILKPLSGPSKPIDMSQLGKTPPNVEQGTKEANDGGNDENE